MSDRFLRLVPSDVITLNLRGTSRRLRINKTDYSQGVLKLTCRDDRKSAYQSEVGFIPLPAPTPPVSTVPGESVLAVLDIPALRDEDDSLTYYAAATGVRPAWSGAELQRSLDGGATYADVLAMTWAATIGKLTAPVASASPWYTDTTNSIVVDLVRTGDSLDSITDVQLLNRGGAVAISLPGDKWEIVQYRDAEHLGGQQYRLSHLHRGQLNTSAGAHAAGDVLVVLDDVGRASAESAWLQVALTHRAASFGTSPESATPQTQVYEGESQREWPVAELSAAATGGNIVATCVPRYRFGNDTHPVASANFTGFRWTAGSVTIDTLLPTVELSALGATTISVSQINRITGPGPAVTVSL